MPFREVKGLLLGRGVIVVYETVRRWSLEFGQSHAACCAADT
ncbi:hypothetical protein ACFYTG_50445 [Streptomyces mirabilis]